jgi:hypothetical protein
VAAQQTDRAQAERASEVREDLEHLLGELAGRDHDDGLDVVALGVDPLDHRETEGERLAAAGLGETDDVLAGEELGDRGRLDGRRFGEAEAADRGERLAAQPQFGERRGCGGLGARKARARFLDDRGELLDRLDRVVLVDVDLVVLVVVIEVDVIEVVVAVEIVKVIDVVTGIVALVAGAGLAPFTLAAASAAAASSPTGDGGGLLVVVIRGVVVGGVCVVLVEVGRDLELVVVILIELVGILGGGGGRRGALAFAEVGITEGARDAAEGAGAGDHDALGAAQALGSAAAGREDVASAALVDGAEGDVLGQRRLEGIAGGAEPTTTLLGFLAALVELVAATAVLRDATPAVLLAGGAAALLAAALPIVATIAAVRT